MCLGQLGAFEEVALAFGGEVVGEGVLADAVEFFALDTVGIAVFIEAEQDGLG